MEAHIAFLSKGELRVRAPDGRISEPGSPYADHVRERRFEIKRRQEWKHSGAGAQFAGGAAILEQLTEEASAPIRVSAVSRGPGPGEVAYALESIDVGGVFVRQVAGELGDERRLFHQAGLVVQGLSKRPGQADYAYAKTGELGTTNLAMYREEGVGFSDLTGGDSVDLAPAWNAAGDRIVYQSARIGRNEAGIGVAHAPIAVEELDVDRGRVTTRAEDPEQDFLQPRLGQDGELYYVRRPYTSPHQRLPPWRHLLDLLLVPVRFLQAIFAWLSFFSARYTGRPLTTAGAPGPDGPDPKEMWILGNMVNARKVAKEAREAGEEVPGLVPQSWQLVRRAPTGPPEVLASGVLCYDLTPQGSVVFSNGRALFGLDGKGERELLAKGERIEALAVIDAVSASPEAGNP